MLKGKSFWYFSLTEISFPQISMSRPMRRFPFYTLSKGLTIVDREAGTLNLSLLEAGENEHLMSCNVHLLIQQILIDQRNWTYKQTTARSYMTRQLWLWPLVWSDHEANSKCYATTGYKQSVFGQWLPSFLFTSPPSFQLRANQEAMLPQAHQMPTS